MQQKDFNSHEQKATEEMTEAVQKYQKSLQRIVIGRANPQVLDTISIDYFDTLTPISQLVSINTPGPLQIIAKPFDASLSRQITSAINDSSTSISAVNEGDRVRITFPELTTDRREELVKSIAKYTEQAKVAIRAARQDFNKAIKADSFESEDQVRLELNDVQKLTDKFIAQIDQITKEKETNLMTI